MRSSSLVLCGVLAPCRSRLQVDVGHRRGQGGHRARPQGDRHRPHGQRHAHARHGDVAQAARRPRSATRRRRRTTTSSCRSAALDPFKQIDSVFVAFPQSGERAEGVRGDPARHLQRGASSSSAPRSRPRRTAATSPSPTTTARSSTPTASRRSVATSSTPRPSCSAARSGSRRSSTSPPARAQSAKDNAELVGAVKQRQDVDALWGAASCRSRRATRSRTIRACRRRRR